MRAWCATTTALGTAKYLRSIFRVEGGSGDDGGRCGTNGGGDGSTSGDWWLTGAGAACAVIAACLWLVRLHPGDWLEPFTAAGRMTLSLYVAQRPGRMGLLKLALHALFGKLSQAKDFDIVTTTEVEIATRHRRLRVATDGEVTVMNTPLQYRIRPAALDVIVPATVPVEEH